MTDQPTDPDDDLPEDVDDPTDLETPEIPQTTGPTDPDAASQDPDVTP